MDAEIIYYPGGYRKPITIMNDETYSTVQVLDRGFIRLDEVMADDLSVVNSARVSFGKRHFAIEEGDDKLIQYLMREQHGTPFEHNSFRFHIKAPIFIFREWQRHRIGSFNEMSGRYTELPGEWYIPDSEDCRVRVGKPGAYKYEKADNHMAASFVLDLGVRCEQSYKDYQYYLDLGLAPEQARLFLHVNHYSEMYWTVNARSLMNFLSLRNAPTAQWEIQQYAKEIEKVFARAMPITHEAFVANRRNAP